MYVDKVELLEHKLLPLPVQQALTHSSYTSLYGTTEDHVKTSMSHCGLRKVEHVGQVPQGLGRSMAALEEAVERMARGEKDSAPRYWWGICSN